MRRNILFKILLSLFVVVLGLFVSELFLRYLKPAKLVGFTYMPLVYKLDEQNGYSYQENSRGRMHRNFEIDNEVVINSGGFHDIERNIPDRYENLRIVALGDSFTASLHVGVLAMWTQILEQHLSKSGAGPVEVVNLGLDGTGTDIQVNILSSYLRSHQADVVILAFYANDIDDMKLFKIYRENYKGYLITYQSSEQKRKILNFIDQNNPSCAIKKIYEYSYTFRAIVRALCSLNVFEEGRLMFSNYVRPKDVGIEDMSQYSYEELEQRITGVFGRMIALSKQKDFKLIIVPLPSREDQSESISALNENIPAELMQEMMILDVVPAMNDLLEEHGLDYDRLYWNDDRHFNKLGNDIFAQALMRMLYQDRVLNAKMPN